MENAIKKTIEWTINEATCPSMAEVVAKFSEFSGEEQTDRSVKIKFLTFFIRKPIHRYLKTCVGGTDSFVATLYDRAEQACFGKDLVFDRKEAEAPKAEKNETSPTPAKVEKIDSEKTGFDAQAGKLHTLDEVAEDLRLTKRTLYTYVRGGVLKAVKIGKFWRVTEEALAEFKRSGTPVLDENRRKENQITQLIKSLQGSGGGLAPEHSFEEAQEVFEDFGLPLEPETTMEKIEEQYRKNISGLSAKKDGRALRFELRLYHDVLELFDVCWYCEGTGRSWTWKDDKQVFFECGKCDGTGKANH